MALNRFRKTVAVERGVPSIPTSALVHGYLTDDGSDATLNENYAAATDAYYAATQPFVVESIVLDLVDSDVAQNAVLGGESFVGGAALTNGIKLRIENSAGTLLVDIADTVAIKDLNQLSSISSVYNEKSSVASATTTANFHAVSAKIVLADLFGKAIEVNNTDRIVAVLNDDFSGLARFQIHFFGYLI